MAEKKHSFLAPHSEERDVNGKKLQFFAVSTRTLFRLKTLAAPIAQSLVTIMSGKSQDIKRTSRDFSDPSTGDMGQETILEPIALDLAKHRDKERAGAVQNLVEALATDENRYLVGSLICDSLREKFPRPVTDETIREFMDDDDMTLPTMVALVSGVVAVNKGAFGPLAGPLAAKLKALTDERLKVVKDEEEEAPEEGTK